MGCVYGASVTRAIKSMTLDYLLISFSVNLKPEKNVSKIRNDPGNSYT